MWRLILAALFLLPSVAGAQWGAQEDLYSISSHPRGAARYSVHKFGRNQDADTTEDSIWEGSDLGGPIRCFTVIGTTATVLYVSSDDENDAAKEVSVEGLDGDWALKSITVALGVDTTSGGTTMVALGTGTWMRVNRAYATDVALVGNIYIGDDAVDAGGDGIPDNVATSLVTGIVIGENQTLQACYSVPSGYNAFFVGYCASNGDTVANAIVNIRLRKAINGQAARNQSILQFGEATSSCFNHSPPIRFVEKTDVELTTVSDKNDATATGEFDLVLIKNTLSGL
jgi:hypothetical protein